MRPNTGVYSRAPADEDQSRLTDQLATSENYGSVCEQAARTAEKQPYEFLRPVALPGKEEKGRRAG